jgi:hypothetical protein
MYGLRRIGRTLAIVGLTIAGGALLADGLAIQSISEIVIGAGMVLAAIALIVTWFW